MSLIQKVFAREILDSRGNPTIEVEITTKQNRATYKVPSGASKGKYECVELRDNDKRFHGMGVLKAVSNVNNIIASKLIGMEVSEQQKIDRVLIELDGTKNKSNLGGNALTGVSLACLRAAGMDLNLPLFKYIRSKYTENKTEKFSMPTPFINVINGGTHSNNNLDIQEFMIVPKLSTFALSLRAGAEIFHTLKKVLSEKGMSVAVGDEGGFAPNLSNNKQALELILESIQKSGYVHGENIFLALDVAANELFKDNKYSWDNRQVTGDELLSIYEKLISDFPLISIEDPFSEQDTEGWKKITGSNDIQIVGDDLFVTNVKKVKAGAKEKLANSLLVKCNQIGTFSEAMEAVGEATKNKFSKIMSHRSADTSDDTLADLALGLDCEGIKAGGLSRSERISKYNRLLAIENML